MKCFLAATRFLVFMTIVLGIIYPLAMTGIAQVLFPTAASGDFISRGGQIVGSSKIAQNFQKAEYFWPRPSAIGYNPLPSGGSNLGQANLDLKKAVEERRTRLQAAHLEANSGQSIELPQDLLFASASGLDPHISPEAAQYQLRRVAKSRNLPLEQVQKLIEQATVGRQLALFGEPTVNVLKLNLALDQSQGIDKAPEVAPPPAEEKK